MLMRAWVVARVCKRKLNVCVSEMGAGVHGSLSESWLRTWEKQSLDVCVHCVYVWTVD